MDELLLFMWCGDGGTGGMKVYERIFISCCAFMFGYFAHWSNSERALIAPAVFAFFVWLALVVYSLFTDD